MMPWVVELEAVVDDLDDVVFEYVRLQNYAVLPVLLCQLIRPIA